MENCLYKFKIDFDKNKLLQESKVFNYKPVNKQNFLTRSSDEIHNDDLSFIENNGQWWEEQTSWNASREPKTSEFDISESRRILALFKTMCDTDDIKSNFLTQEKNTEVLLHTDPGTTCKINFVLQGGHTPVVFKGYNEDFYDIALLNITIPHSVPVQTDMKRVLYTLRFTKDSYEDVKQKIKERNK
tara:strand:+ start:58203 stop:58763 length:561 start_codon:yes stop_codon:yes gene_type:complete